MEARSEETRTEAPTTVLVVDDHPVVRAGLKALLSREPRLQVVGDCGTAIEALRLGAQLHPQVVLLDIRLPDLDGLETAHRLRGLATPPRVVLLSSFVDPALVSKARQAGVSGYLLKDVGEDRLVANLLRVAAGEIVLAPEVESILWDPPAPGTGSGSEPEFVPRPVLRPFHQPDVRPDFGLNPREVEVMDLVAQGKVNKEIADQLGLSVGTVRNLLTSIFVKLGAATRTEAAIRWMQRRSPR